VSVLGVGRREALLTCFGLLLAAGQGHTRVLRNDSLEPGERIGFYPNMNGGDGVAVVLSVPEDVVDYTICAIQTWFGPDDFTVVEARISSAIDDASPDVLLWMGDLDAFQLFGSEVALSEIDLRAERLDFGRDEADRLHVFLRHAEGFGGPPSIGYDGDGITAGSNWLYQFQRNGNFLVALTETLVDEGRPPRPPGDWVVRLLIAENGEPCPVTEAVQADGGIIEPPPPPRDAGVPPPPRRDAEPDDVKDAAPPLPRRDASPLEEDAAAPGGEEMGRPLDELTVDIVAPTSGRSDEDTPIAVKGRGFPLDSEVRVRIGDVRALEPEVTASSSLTAVVPAGLQPGRYDLSVERLVDGQRAILPQAYTVLGEGEPAPFSLLGLSPTNVTEGETPIIIFSGSGFTADTRFVIGNSALTPPAVESEGWARAQLLEALPVGTFDVVAFTSGTEARLAGAFRVTARPGRSASSGCHIENASPSSPALILLAASALFLGRRRTRRPS
jgi:hypothetical protein